MSLLALLDAFKLLQEKAAKKMVKATELAYFTGVPLSRLSMGLVRASQKGKVFRIKTWWMLAESPPTLNEVGLTLFAPAYISLETALYHHGILSQSPRGRLWLVTRGRPQTLETRLGSMQAVQFKPDLFCGFDADLMAYPEKALLDLIYYRQKRGINPLWTEEISLTDLNPQRLKELGALYPAAVRSELKRVLPDRKARRKAGSGG